MLIEVPLLLRIVRVDSKTIFDSDYPIEEDSCSERQVCCARALIATVDGSLTGGPPDHATNDVGLPRFRQRFRNNIIMSLQIDLCPNQWLYISVSTLGTTQGSHTCIHGPVVDFTRWLD